MTLKEVAEEGIIEGLPKTNDRDRAVIRLGDERLIIATVGGNWYMAYATKEHIAESLVL